MKKSDNKSFLILHPKNLKYKIKIRNHPIDKITLVDDLYKKYSLPPKGFNLPDDATVIDLGCNIGLTVAQMKNIYPNVRIIGYEMDTDN